MTDRKSKGRRGHGSGSVYQNGTTGRWEVVLDLGYITGPDGSKRRKRVKRTRDTQRDAITALEEMKRDHYAGTLQQGKSPRLADYLAEWLSVNGAERWRENTATGYRTAVNRMVPVIGHIRLSDLRSANVEALLAGMAESYARGTIQHARNVLRIALNDAVRDDKITRNVAAKARLPRHVATPTTVARPLSLSELPRFLNAARDHDGGAILTVAVYTGLRLGELRGLTWEALDMDDGTLTVSQQVQDGTGGWKVTPPKSDHARRTVPLQAGAVAALKRQHRHQLEQRVLSGGRWVEHGFVFTSETGNPLAITTVTNILNAVLSAASLPRRRFHDLRHSFASYLISHGADLMTVRDLCGHSTITITADTYGHLFPNRRQEVMAAWDTLEAVAS